MSEAEVGTTEGGGAPLPPKRPTIIRPPPQDGRGPVPARPAPARPAPVPPGGRGPPASAKPTPAAAGSPMPSRPQKPAMPPASPALQKKPESDPAKNAGKHKSQGSVRKRPEITIVDARPMSQAGFRDVRSDNASAGESAVKPSSNGNLPVIPNRPPPSSSASATPTHPRPAAPPSRPNAPLQPAVPPLQLQEKPLIPPPQENPSGPPPPPEKADSGHSDPPGKPMRPTILRPGRPKSSAVPASSSSSAADGAPLSPPPPLPKRSPIVSDSAPVADLMGWDPPPKPERSSLRLSDDVQGEGKKEEEEEEGEKERGEAEGEGHGVVKKPTRVTIIRPPSRPKPPPAQDGQRTAEPSEEPPEASSQHCPRPKPPVPVSRPVAVVPASPRDSPGSSPRSDHAEHTGTAPPPVPASRPKTSPRDAAEKPPLVTDRPRPPVPASRPQAPPSVSPPSASPPLASPPGSAEPPAPPSRPSPASRPQAPPSVSPHGPAEPPEPPSRPSPASRPQAPPSVSPHGPLEAPEPPSRPSPASRPQAPPSVSPYGPAEAPEPPSRPAPASRPQAPPSASPPRPSEAPEPPSRPAPASAAPPVPATRPQAVPSASPPVPVSRPSQAVGGLPPPPAKPPPPASASPSPAKHPLPPAAVPADDSTLYAVSEPLEDSLDRMRALDNQPSRPPPPVPKSRPQSAGPPPPSMSPAHPPHPSMVGRPLPSVPSLSSSESPSSEQGHLYEDVDEVKNRTRPVVEKPQTPALSPTLRNSSVESAAVEESPEDIEAMYAKVNKPRRPPSSAPLDAGQSDSPAPSPFGVKLKRVASDDPPEPGQLTTDSESLEAKRPSPTLAPKPKPGVLPKPQPAAKPKSPRKEALPENPAQEGPSPEVTTKEDIPGTTKPDIPAPTKPDIPEQSKPLLIAKRPTIIRSQRPSAEADPTSRREEDGGSDVEMRDKRAALQSRPQSQVSGGPGGGGKEWTPPVPSKRPVTIIGFPRHKPRGPEKEEEEGEERLYPSLPVPSDGEASLENGASPPVVRPPPPRPHSRPGPPPSSLHDQPNPPPASPARNVSDAEPARKTSDAGFEPVGPPRPASPAPPRPALRPVVPATTAAAASQESGAVEDGATGGGGASALRFTPPVRRKELGHSHEEEVRHRPPRPGGAPSRPMSMPPVKPALTAATTTPHAATVVKSDQPSRPQPMRPPVPKEEKLSSPPLPGRPGLSHPLYGYMASQPHAIAVHDYPANQPDEVAFQEGDTVVLLKRVDEQWLMGKVGDREGIFPQNFVTIIHPLHDELISPPIDDTIDGVFEDEPLEKPDLLQGPRCRARFDFEGEGHGDLAFEDGDVIQLLAHCGGDWLRGELHGRQGIFPASFVEIIEDLLAGEDSQASPSGKGSEVSALFDFSGELGELSFQAGDTILILGKVNEQWLFGQCGGNEGSFPASFIDAVPVDLPFHSDVTSQGSPANPRSHADNSSAAPDKPKRYCTALYSFEKTQDGDLDFKEGDIMEIVDEVGQDWLKGRLNGREGMFPAAFVTLDQGGPLADETDPGSGLAPIAVLGKALFHFDGQADNELTFQAGEEIVLGSLVAEDGEWQWGELHGHKGMFPASFVEMI